MLHCAGSRGSRMFFRGALTLALLVAAACTSNEPIRPDPGGAAGPSCPSGRGPRMVAIVLPGVASFCIDSTEVSQAQYAQFLAAKVDPAKQSRDLCVKRNLTFEPLVNVGPEDWKGCPPGIWAPETRGEMPASCVDHCDAVAFCEWAGKRLCGAIGGGPRPADEKDVYPGNSEWYLACSQGGKYKYPYGDTYEDGKCVDPPGAGEPGQLTGTFSPRAAGPSACHGQEPPFDGLFEMVGNVSEWDDHCRAEGLCSVRGGGGEAVPAIDCTSIAETSAHNSAFLGFGIRCCADYK